MSGGALLCLTNTKCWLKFDILHIFRHAVNVSPRKRADNELEMPEVRCSTCEICAYDTAAPLFGSAYLMVSDDGCSYFVAGGEYLLKCQYVRGRRDGFMSVTDNPCPRLKKAVASRWRAPVPG